MVGQPVGLPVQFRVGLRRPLVAQGDPVRVLLDAPLEQLRYDLADLSRARAGSQREQVRPFALRRHQDLGEQLLRIGGDRLEHGSEPGTDRLDLLTSEQVRAVAEPHPEGLPGKAGDAQRVVVGVGAVGTGEPDVARQLLEVALLQRIVLGDRQRVEQLPDTGEPLDVRQAQVLVRDAPRLIGLERRQHRDQGPVLAEPYPHRQGVDEQADHVSDAGDLGRAARDRGSEDDVVAAGQPAEHHGPTALQKRVERQVAPPRHLRQPCGEFLGQRHGEVLRSDRGRFVSLAGQQCRLLDAFEDIAPDALGRPAVLPCQPAHVLAVRRHPAHAGVVAAAPVQLEQVAHHDAGRPTVEQDVMAGHHQSVVLLAPLDQGEPQERRRGQVELRPGILFRQLVERSLLLLGVAVREVDLPERERHLAGNHLNGLAQLLEPEAGTEVAVPPQQGPHSGTHPRGVERPLKVQDELCDVNVERLLLVERVKEQTLLEGCHRQDILEPRLRRHGILHSSSRRSISSWSSSASARSDGV